MNDEQEILVDIAFDAAKTGADAEGESGNVGAAVRAADGEIYTGSVVTTEDNHQSLHAERLAIANAVTAYESPNPVEALAVHMAMAPDEEWPHARICGSCLHFLAEFSTGDIPIYIGHMTGVRETSLRTLYPEPWSKSPESDEYP